MVCQNDPKCIFEPFFVINLFYFQTAFSNRFDESIVKKFNGDDMEYF